LLLFVRPSVGRVATRCQILRRWGSAPDPAVGAYSAPPDPLAGFKGPTSKGRGREGRGGVVREGKVVRKGSGGERKGGQGRGILPPPASPPQKKNYIFGLTPRLHCVPVSKSKGQRSGVTGRLTQTNKLRHIFRTVRPKKSSLLCGWRT